MKQWATVRNWCGSSCVMEGLLASASWLLSSALLLSPGCSASLYFRASVPTHTRLVSIRSNTTQTRPAARQDGVAARCVPALIQLVQRASSKTSATRVASLLVEPEVRQPLARGQERRTHQERRTTPKSIMASTGSTSSAASAPDDGLPDPRRLFPPVATAGLETLPSAHDVSGLEPAPPPPAPLQSPKKKKRPLSLFCSCT
jgi:hypothetical protein